MAGKAGRTREMLYMFLHAPPGPGGPVPEYRVQGGMILLAKSPIDFDLDLEYGPDLRRSAGLSGAIRDGIMSGHVAESVVGGRPGYALGAEGIKAAEDCWRGADRRIRDDIACVKEMMDGMTYEETMLFMAVSFPEYLDEPGIRAGLADVRVDAACSLFKKDKGTIAKCAAIAGFAYQDFVTLLLARGIEPYEVTKEDEERVMRTIHLLADA